MSYGEDEFLHRYQCSKRKKMGMYCGMMNCIENGQHDEFKAYFLKTWPVALEKVKELSEKN